jgi:hypothetical protein
MKKIRGLTKNRIILLCVVCVLAIAATVLTVTAAARWHTLSCQRAAERFRGDSDARFAQVSAFFPEGKGTDLKGVYTFRQSLETALVAAAVEAPEGGSVWKDAYAAKSSVTVVGGKASSAAETLGVGGDWFYFHDLKLRSGVYLSETDLMHDRVVLDETLAWKLFGGFDLAGMTVTIGGKQYIIAGVVELESDKASLKARGESGGVLIMHYDALNAMAEIKITSYELVCANPITGFALETLKKGFADAATVENSVRFRSITPWGAIKNFGTRSVSSVAVAYPYWENAARITEDQVALLRVIAFLLYLLPAGYAIWWLIKALRVAWAWLRRKVAALWENTSESIRKRQRKKIEEKSKTW